MLQNPSPVDLVPISPLLAEGRILAGFLDEVKAFTLPEFARASAADQSKAREKFGAIERIGGRIGIQSPSFRDVGESEAIAALAKVASRSQLNLTLNNLTGFQWVEIAGIIAGKYASAPMPQEGRSPNEQSSVEQVAKFCLFGEPIVAERDLSVISTPAGIVLVSSEPVRLFPQMHPNFGPNKGLIVEYVMDIEPSPIALFAVDDRVVAISHQERLVALFESGVKEALCLVYFGYGTDSLQFFPRIEPTSLTGSTPAYISDFTDDNLMVRVPVVKPRTLITLSHQAIDLALIEQVASGIV